MNIINISKLQTGHKLALGALWLNSEWVLLHNISSIHKTLSAFVLTEAAFKELRKLRAYRDKECRSQIKSVKPLTLKLQEIDGFKKHRDQSKSLVLAVTSFLDSIDRIIAALERTHTGTSLEVTSRFSGLKCPGIIRSCSWITPCVLRGGEAKNTTLFAAEFLLQVGPSHYGDWNSPLSAVTDGSRITSSSLL